MATTYIVTATSAHAESKAFSRKEYAVRDAELKAEALGRAEAVTVVTGTGTVVHTTEVAAPKPVKAGNRGARRAALGPAALPGWEVLYDKPRKAAQVWRSTEGNAYMLVCVPHMHTEPMERLSQDREMLREGTWCPSCTGEATEEAMVENEVNDDIAAGVITPEHLAALKAVHAAATTGGSWDPNAAALAAPVAELEALGLVESVNNTDEDEGESNVWVYLTDKGDLTLTTTA